ncbi:hypothetical protein [Catellatospora chokoriensis]|uniref:Uncharacterized protein n=1 Tax=Catellatospora chokoriensis TaxID=310353 RepID=A0A8J3JUN1_9ACTN|nr:hypothetical protein [Catellatospora chokoriensis]GIF91382.1 hypothetical protein Cch02nite_48260 [Catellatospora chokoriensis]
MSTADQQTQMSTYTRTPFPRLFKMLAPPILALGTVAGAVVAWFFGIGSGVNMLALFAVLLTFALCVVTVLEHQAQPLPYTPMSRIVWVINAHLPHILDDLVLYRACAHTQPEPGCVCHLHTTRP